MLQKHCHVSHLSSECRDSVEEMRQILACSSCNKRFSPQKSPLSFGCCHFFCPDCVYSFSENSCPVCNYFFSRKDVKKIAMVSYMVETLQELEKCIIEAGAVLKTVPARVKSKLKRSILKEHKSDARKTLVNTVPAFVAEKPEPSPPVVESIQETPQEEEIVEETQPQPPPKEESVTPVFTAVSPVEASTGKNALETSRLSLQGIQSPEDVEAAAVSPTAFDRSTAEESPQTPICCTTAVSTSPEGSVNTIIEQPAMVTPPKQRPERSAADPVTVSPLTQPPPEKENPEIVTISPLEMNFETESMSVGCLRSLRRGSSRRRNIVLLPTCADEEGLALLDQLQGESVKGTLVGDPIRLSSSFSPKVTHVVLPRNDRIITVKLLLGVSHGLWIVTLDWIRACLREGAIVSEEPYEVTRISGCRTMRLGQGLQLLQGFAAVVYPPIMKEERTEEIREVLNTLGCKVFRDEHQLLAFHGARIRLAIVDPQWAQWRDFSLKKWDLLRSRNVSLVDYKWVFHTVLSGMQVKMKKFVVSPPPHEDIIESVVEQPPKKRPRLSLAGQ